MKASAFSTIVIVFTAFGGTCNNACHFTDVDRPSLNFYESDSLFTNISDLSTVMWGL